MLKKLKTLRICLSIQNTIIINQILNLIRSIPIIGKYITEEIHSLWIIKVLGTIYSVVRELTIAFFGRFFLFLTLLIVSGMFSSLNGASQGEAFLYYTLLVQMIGLFCFNAFFVWPETEYAVFFLGMDAKEYVITRLFRSCTVSFAGYLIWGIPAALLAGVKWYTALLLPFMAVGFRLWSTAGRMMIYERKIRRKNEKNGTEKIILMSGNAGISIAGILGLFFGGGLAYGWLCYYYSGQLLFQLILSLLVLLGAFLVIPAILIIKRFPYGLYRTALSGERNRIEMANTELERKKKKSKEVEITEGKKKTEKYTGYRYLHEIFMKRHRKVFLKRMISDMVGVGIIIAFVSVLLYVEVVKYNAPEKSMVRAVISGHSAVFPFVLFAVNSTEWICRAMYLNCDKSMLIYGFYRKPKVLAKMFWIRVLSTVKLNLIPALMMAVFSTVALFVSGGEDYPLQILFIVLEIFVSIFLFSLYYLMLYYLIQPYGEEGGIRIRIRTALVFPISFTLFVLISFKINAVILTLFGMLFTGLLAFAATGLIRRFGTKTFK